MIRNTLLLCLLFTTLLTQAQSYKNLENKTKKYAFLIDCYDANVSATETTNEIEVSWWYNSELLSKSSKNGRLTGSTKNLTTGTRSRSAPKCSKKGPAIYFPEKPLPKKPTHVIVETNGTDGFWMDRCMIFKPKTKGPIAEFASNGGKGYCLSTQIADGEGAWKSKSWGCYKAYKFDIITRKASPMQENVDHHTKRYVYQVVLDCFHKDLSSEGTSNEISVTLYNGNAALVTKRKIPKCSKTAPATFTFPEIKNEITHVRVESNGSDGFFIDKVVLKRSNPTAIKSFTKVKQWGADNGKGYCLSTDANDANGAWKGSVDKCAPALVLHMSGNSYYSNEVKSYGPSVKKIYRDSTVLEIDDPGTAEMAYYTVGIDFTHKNLQSTSSSDNIVVYLIKSGGGAKAIKVQKGFVHTNAPLGMNLIYNFKGERGTIIGVEVEIEGDDHFFIDKITLRKSLKKSPLNTGKVVKTWGRRGGGGYCLSRDTEVPDQWKDKVSSCTPSRKFMIKN